MVERKVTAYQLQKKTNIFIAKTILLHRSVSSSDFTKIYNIDATLNEFSISGIVDELKMLEPYGEGFRKPVFLVKLWPSQARFINW